MYYNIAHYFIGAHEIYERYTWFAFKNFCRI